MIIYLHECSLNNLLIKNMECSICYESINENNIFKPCTNMRCECYTKYTLCIECFNKIINPNKCAMCGTWIDLNVNNDGLLIKHIDNPSIETCTDAVKQNGLALEFIPNQTEELCIEAVCENGFALQFVDEQTDEICYYAIMECADSFQFVLNKTQELCETALNEDGLTIRFIENKTVQFKKIALDEDLESEMYF